MFQGLGKSTREYGSAVAKWWWVIVIAGVLELIGAFTFFFGSVSMLPGWVLVAIPFVGLTIAQFLAYHDVRIKRDEITGERDKLKEIQDYELALDELSKKFDYGNNKIFNAIIGDDIEFGSWKERWARWQEEVEVFLDKKFGLRERNLFRNIVLFNQLPFGDHAKERSMVAWQLDSLRNTIVRYSDRVQRWRAESTSASKEPAGSVS